MALRGWVDDLAGRIPYADSMRQMKAARLRMQGLANAAGESFITVLLDRLDALSKAVSDGKTPRTGNADRIGELRRPS